MKRYLAIGSILTFSVLLAGCAYNRYPTLNSDYTKETWSSQIDRNPTKWTKGADRWFMTGGDPNSTEMANRNAPDSAAISTMMVRVPDFTKIISSGAFQVQIFGTYDNNSVYVYGPNSDVRETMVKVRGDTLYLGQSDRAGREMRKVIIRVGVANLKKIVQQGSGTIEAIQIPSSAMTVVSNGSGDMYLAGNMNLSEVTANGSGRVSIFGANTPKLDIKTSSMATVNVSGRVGLHSVEHHGKGDINVIGAFSNQLNIIADGRGKVGISGFVNLKEIKARDYVSVYINEVNGGALYVYADDYSKVGLAGGVDDLYVYTSGGSDFYGRYLLTRNAFIKAQGNSHVNVTANNKIFAAAIQSATIYFFGEPRLMSQFVSGNGTVIPVWTDSPVPYRRQSLNRRVYKDSFQGSGATSFRSPYKYRWQGGKLISTPVDGSADPVMG